jgi:hypothetical protein
LCPINALYPLYQHRFPRGMGIFAGAFGLQLPVRGSFWHSRFPGSGGGHFPGTAEFTTGRVPLNVAKLALVGENKTLSVHSPVINLVETSAGPAR